MDEGDLKFLFMDELSKLDWGQGLDKIEIYDELQDYEPLQILVAQYVADGTYSTAEEVCLLIPEQAWQDAQGDGEWHGGQVQDIPGMESHFREGPVGRDDSDVYHPGAAPPPTPGFGQSAGAQTGAPTVGVGGATTPSGDDPFGDDAAPLGTPGTSFESTYEG
jgi:hypothetical protein